MLNNVNYSSSWNGSSEVNGNLIATFFANYNGNDITLNVNIVDLELYNTNSQVFDTDFIQFKNEVMAAINDMQAV